MCLLIFTKTVLMPKRYILYLYFECENNCNVLIIFASIMYYISFTYTNYSVIYSRIKRLNVINGQRSLSRRIGDYFTCRVPSFNE